MARVNVGVDPTFISDQHLIAESVEITMITGGLKANNFLIKTPIPKEFTLGKGHINFLKDKLMYLAYRLLIVNTELNRRGIQAKTCIELSAFPTHLRNDWTPTQAASNIVRERIADRLVHPLKAKPGFHKYHKQPIQDIQEFGQKLIKSPLHEI